MKSKLQEAIQRIHASCLTEQMPLCAVLPRGCRDSSGRIEDSKPSKPGEGMLPPLRIDLDPPQ